MFMYAKQTPDPVWGFELKKYFLEFATQDKNRSLGFYRVHTDLPVFKKVLSQSLRDHAIANLIIPAGALIFAAERVWSDQTVLHDRKMRASKAFVHSIVKADYDCSNTEIEITRAMSGWAHSFIYAKGQTVKPLSAFDLYQNTCTSGIHFFLNVRDAYCYSV